jgi:hypothetical protein
MHAGVLDTAAVAHTCLWSTGRRLYSRSFRCAGELNVIENSVGQVWQKLEAPLSSA